MTARAWYIKGLKVFIWDVHCTGKRCAYRDNTIGDINRWFSIVLDTDKIKYTVCLWTATPGQLDACRLTSLLLSNGVWAFCLEGWFKICHSYLLYSQKRIKGVRVYINNSHIWNYFSNFWVFSKLYKKIKTCSHNNVKRYCSTTNICRRLQLLYCVRDHTLFPYLDIVLLDNEWWFILRASLVQHKVLELQKVQIVAGWN